MEAKTPRPKRDLSKDPPILRQLLRIVPKKQRGRIVLLLIGSILGAVLETVTVGMMLPFMNTIMDIDTLEGSRWRIVIYRVFGCESVTDLLIVIALLLAFLYVAKGVYKYLLQYAQARSFSRMRTQISISLFDTLLNMPYRYHLHNTTAEMQRTVTTDVDRSFYLITNLMTVISEGAASLGILLLLVSVDPALTIGAILLISAIMLLANRVVLPVIRKRGHQELMNNTGMLAWVNQAAGGLKGIYAGRRQAYFVKSYAEHASSAAENHASITVLMTLPKELVETLTMAGIFVFMAVLVGRGGDLTNMLPLFATFAIAAVRLIPVANRVTNALAEINYKRYSLSAVYHIIADNGVDVDSKALRSAAEGVRPLASTEPLTEGVKIEHLRFRFEDAQEDLYTDLSLTIPAGKSVAFIGVTGSGKTTLADVLLGLHAPLSGRVLADGHNIHEEPVWWADRVGYIPQMIYLCNDSIRKNVAFGFSEKDIDDTRVWHCLEEAQLKEFVEGLPDGLDSLTGENGVRLSGGQRQRIGIARALYTDPQFLVMDEATSALDNETERAIIESVNRLAGKKTLLIIAHRLTTIEDCDLVFRIENGQARLVREKGKAG